MKPTERLDALIQAYAEAQESYTAAEISELLVNEHRDEVVQWAEDCLFSIVREFVGNRLRATRYMIRQGRERSDDHGRSIFDQDFVVDEAFTRKRLGAMTGPDHRFVAAEYDRAASEAKQYAALHRLIAKRVGARRTDEVFTEEQLQSLFGGKVPDKKEAAAA